MSRSRISTSLVRPSRPDARRLKARLAWFVAAYVLVATVATAVADGLRGDPPTPPQSPIVSTAGGKSSPSIRTLQHDARDGHSAPV